MPDSISAPTSGNESFALEQWRGKDMDTLIGFVLERFHARHREQLPELIHLAQKVEYTHANHQACPGGLAALLDEMAAGLESHMMKEERVLFPMLLNGMRGPACAPIQVMRLEHEQHEDDLRRLMTLTGQLQLPEEACATWRALYSGIRVFVADLRMHIALENEVIFV